MGDDLLRRKPVEGLGVAVHPANRDRPSDGETGFEGPRQMPGRQQVDARACRRRPAAVGKAPDIVTPIQYITRVADVRRQVDAHGGTVGFVCMFILAPPLHQDFAARQRPGHKGGVQGRVVCAVVPIASRAVDVGDCDVLERHVEHAGKGSAQRFYALARAKNLQTAPMELSARGRWGEGSVHDERSRIGRSVTAAAFDVRGRIVTVDRMSDEVIIQRSIGSDLALPAPNRAFPHPRGEYGSRVFVGMCDGNEAAVDHKFRRGSEIDLEMLQPVVRRGWPDHAGVKVASKVLDERVPAARLGLDIETWMMPPSNETVVRGTLLRRRLNDVEIESPGVRPPVVHGLVDARRRDLAVGHGHRIDWYTQFPPRR